ncbi:hypothetical protein ACUXCC_003584 [Cytobacillus horneckiae]
MFKAKVAIERKYKPLIRDSLFSFNLNDRKLLHPLL